MGQFHRSSPELNTPHTISLVGRNLYSSSISN